MSILSGYFKVKDRLLTDSGYKLLSRWTSSDTVECNDGKTIEAKVGGINGIVKTLNDLNTTTDSSIVPSATAVKAGLDAVNSSLAGKAASSHTHSYAGSSSAGGAATTALACTGNAATATQLVTASTINGTSFNGTANITTANWGTARTVTIGGTGKSVNGSGNVSWTLAEIGAAASSALGTQVTYSLSGTTLNITTK